MTTLLVLALIAVTAAHCVLRRKYAEVRARLDGAFDRIAAQSNALSRRAELTGPPRHPRSPQWPKVRAAHLKLHPTCEACGGKDDLEVHHVWPVSWPDGCRHELEAANLMTLCAGRCHLLFGHLGDYASRNPDARADAADWLGKIKARTYPADWACSAGFTET